MTHCLTFIPSRTMLETDMAKILNLTNREFLRNYRQWKAQLESGLVDKIIIRENGYYFEFRFIKTKQKEEISWKEKLEWLKREGPKIKVKRVPFRFRYYL